MNKSTIIPIPKKYNDSGACIKIKPCISAEKSEWQDILEGFCQCAKKIYGIDFSNGSGGIELIYDSTLDGEAYRLEVDTTVKLYASEAQGVSYGLSSALQLIDGNLEIKAVTVEDKPDKDHRCLMIDLARNWHPFDTLLHYIDLCFFYKIKYIHLHFMDDQSYTLPSTEFPKLPTENRSYSRAQIAELRKAAKSRGVTIIPEIEMPGHAKSLKLTYPELFACDIDESIEIDAVAAYMGAVFGKDSVVCPGSETAFSHLTRLLDEVMSLFPESPYIHIGGDEVNTASWDRCKTCSDYMKRNNIADVGELYCDFIGRITDYVLSKGRTPIVWEGFPIEYADKVSKEVIIINSETHYQMPGEMTALGYRVINASWKPMYMAPEFMGGWEAWNLFDVLDWSVYDWKHWWDKSNSTLNPTHVPPTDKIIGGQLCFWELTYEREVAEVVKRLAALSQRSWSVKKTCTNKEFEDNLNEQIPKAFALIARTTV